MKTIINCQKAAISAAILFAINQPITAQQYSLALTSNSQIIHCESFCTSCCSKTPTFFWISVNLTKTSQSLSNFNFSIFFNLSQSDYQLFNLSPPQYIWTTSPTIYTYWKSRIKFNLFYRIDTSTKLENNLHRLLKQVCKLTHLLQKIKLPLHFLLR